MFADSATFGNMHFLPTLSSFLNLMHVMRPNYPLLSLNCTVFLVCLSVCFCLIRHREIRQLSAIKSSL